MDELKIKIEGLLKLFDSVGHELESITDDNFDSRMEQVSRIQHQIIELKEQLQKEFPASVLQLYNKEFQERAKHISEIFDNIISRKKISLETVKAEISRLQNQKKISSYQR
ncbi:MAG: hypothetical protein LWX56_04865 [Ignavibacteria bacterium]|nr:hypothetical protein [Ignavibacteria bacterium]